MSSCSQPGRCAWLHLHYKLLQKEPARNPPFHPIQSCHRNSAACLPEQKGTGSSCFRKLGSPALPGMAGGRGMKTGNELLSRICTSVAPRAEPERLAGVLGLGQGTARRRDRVGCLGKGRWTLSPQTKKYIFIIEHVK